MASLYGKHWLDMWADIPMDSVKDEWAAGLAKFSLMEIGKAINHCADNLQFPPTLPEFKRICAAMKPGEITKALPRHFTAEEIERNHERLQAEAEKLQKKQERGMKDWAHAIIQRVKDGDRTVSDIAARFAKQAIEAA